MKYIRFFLVISFISLVGLANGQSQNPKKTKPADYTNYKKYVNKKYGFSFLYPGTWVESGPEADVVNLENVTTNTTINFISGETKMSFVVEYFLPPAGRKLYESEVAQYRASQGWYASAKEHMTVAGSKALVANLVSATDGKGHELSKPHKTMVVTFLDKQQTGEIKLQLSVDPDQPGEIADFRKVLSSFEFINAN